MPSGAQHLCGGRPGATLTTVGKVGEGFDADLDGVFAEELEEPAFTMSFTVAQLEGMLTEARRREGAVETPSFKVS